MKLAVSFTFLLILFVSSVGWAEWQSHEIRQLNGHEKQIRLPAKLQIVTEKPKRVVAVPYIIYMPEKDRLLMLVACDMPHRAFVLESNDRGATWTEPRPVAVDAAGKPSVNLSTSLAYLGRGKAVLYGDSGGKAARLFSNDYGQTWGQPVPIAQTSDGKPWYNWDPPLIERDAKSGKIAFFAETGYTVFEPPAVEHSQAQGYIRFSDDDGKTYSKAIKPPQWQGVNEVALVRAANGDLVAACRTDMPERMRGDIDHAEGLGVCTSKDNGRTWSDVTKLYEYGRHHPSMVVMPNRNIVMTYVVRKGYTTDKDGFPRFGIEAVVSRDHGRTWDLDHRYILHSWTGKLKGENYWYPSSQATSSLLLPNGAILTAFGTAYRITENKPFPRDVGLLEWRPNPQPLNADRTMRDAPADSDLRNIFDPTP
jgi:hypothetical protein